MRCAFITASAPPLPTEYKGQDLATIGPMTVMAKSDRLEIAVLSPIGPVSYTFFPIQLDDQAWYDAQLQSEVILGQSGPPPNSPSAFESPTADAGTALDDPSDTESLSASQRAIFGGYHALVIGNNGYRDLPTLETAVNDAETISSLLRSERSCGSRPCSMPTMKTTGNSRPLAACSVMSKTQPADWSTAS